MSVTPTQSADPLKSLAQTLIQRFDSNNDGQLSADEFSTLLGRLLGSVPATGTLANAVNARTTPLMAIEDPPVVDPVSPYRLASPLPAMEGFNTEKLNDPTHKSVKYMFAHVARNYDTSSIHDKASAETVLRAMLPDLKAEGLDVLDVQGDGLKLNIDGQEKWVDVVTGANSTSPRWGWIVQE